MNDPMLEIPNWPPRGTLFTMRGTSWISKIILWRQRLWVWDSTMRNGVTCRPLRPTYAEMARLLDVGRLRFYRHALHADVDARDLQRGFSVLRAQWSKGYDWQFILGGGNGYEDPDGFYCSELTQLFLRSLFGGREWDGMDERPFYPNHVPLLCQDVTAGARLALGYLSRVEALDYSWAH